MQSYAITATCRNVESKSTENAIVCENSGVRMLREKSEKMRPYARRVARLNAKGVKKQRKCDRMREQQRVRALRESENAILYEKSGACEC